MQMLAALPVLVFLTSFAIAADNPDWAYPTTPVTPPRDNANLRSIPGSNRHYTDAEIDDFFNPPDWFPSEHPQMPEIVAHG